MDEQTLVPANGQTLTPNTTPVMASTTVEPNTPTVAPIGVLPVDATSVAGVAVAAPPSNTPVTAVVEQNTTPVATVVPVVAATPPTPGATNTKSILIIEDERPLAHALELKLTHSGFTAKAVNSGEDALNALKEAQYSIILLDLILPGIDGFDLLKKIREVNTTSKIVILSNLGQPEDKAKTEPYNITEYHIKSNIPLSAVVQSLQSLS